MKHTISTTQLRTAIGEAVNTVRLRGDVYVIEQRGKPAAALVPFDVLEKYEAGLKRLAEAVVDLQESVKDVPPEELQKEIDQAVKEARAELRAERLSLRREA